MHHAMAAHASGFGVCNDAAAAIAWLLGRGAERVAYVDIDAHHGDGVQAPFYDDPRVLTISLHQHPAALFSFTGLPSETGGPGAEGSAVNVALPAGTGDAPWLRAFHAVVPPLLARSGRRSWSASTGPTRTGEIRWPAWS
jgi:acetoin utilization protein AcuC